MKSVILILFLLPTYFISAQTDEKQLVFHDKEFLLDYYKQTKNNLSKSISGLSEAQMQFKPSEDKWSVSQCVEHIIATENMIFGMLKTYMEQPENPDRKKDVVLSDDDILGFMTNRSEKYKAPEMLQKKGIYNQPKVALKDFKNQRKELINFIKKTDINELRNRINDSPAGATDAYQSLLFIAGHTARHTLQIDEVKNDPNFPKK
ncbi:DinB family protein [Moheibacter sediminis]|uniref:DinB superfamily protein n=1 Tax=Moheibacter sediminis TaxID=1434700 RepID=A0A1W2AG31_9FLAO|nr:DinB family protein [Moheibacter sediminis]SMC59647.1 DinB superfamily protein [Moheibacter sediminis]